MNDRTRKRKRKEWQQMILVEQTATLARQSTICCCFFVCISLSFHFGYIFQLLREGNVRLKKSHILFPSKRMIRNAERKEN